MNYIKSTLDIVDRVRDDVALGLMSDPGLSKTSQVKQWAEENGRTYCELIISQRMPSEISGMPMPISETRTMEVFDFETLLHLKDGDVLAFDEFTNGNIQTLNACLTLIQERTMLSGKKLPSLVIVAMGNPQGRCDLLPQTKQRFLWVNVIWDKDMWAEYMRKTWGITPTSTVLNYISSQYRNGFSQETFNYVTPRTVENLFKIAKTILRDDPFWLNSGFEPGLIDSIYKSFSNNVLFESIRTSIINNVSFLDRLGTLEALMRMDNIRQLAEMLEGVEREGLFPELIDYVKNNNLMNSDEAPNDSSPI